MSSRDPWTGEDLERAETALARCSRQGQGITFRSVRAALEWFWRTRERMSSPHGMHPRHEIGPDGKAVIVSVDGGRGGDLDDVHATALTIARALARLELDNPQAYVLLVDRTRDGLTLAQMERRHNVSCQMASAHIGRGEYYLLGALRAAEVVV